MLTDDVSSSSTSSSIRKRSGPIYSSTSRNIPLSTKNLTPIINLEDDDEDMRMKKSKSPLFGSLKRNERFTSTPNTSGQKNDEDVTFLNYIETSPRNKSNLLRSHPELLGKNFDFQKENVKSIDLTKPTIDLTRQRFCFESNKLIDLTGKSDSYGKTNFIGRSDLYGKTDLCGKRDSFRKTDFFEKADMYVKDSFGKSEGKPEVFQKSSLGKSIDLTGKSEFEFTKPQKDLKTFEAPYINGNHSGLQNGTKYKTPTSPLSNRRRFNYSSSLDQSFRLEEKKKYSELLSRAAPNSQISSLLNSFSEYGTPIGKIFSNSSSRSKKMVQLAQRSSDKKKPIHFVDLTEDLEKPKDSHEKRRSTKETIEKVLSDFDNDLIVIKDSDSDIEMLPNPPSPKADVIVPRVNSLKKYYDPSEPLHENWIDTL